MTYPIILEPTGHGYLATVQFWPQIHVTGATREEALAAARAVLAEKLKQAEVVMLDWDGDPWQEIAGKYADDDRLREICSEAYRNRDEERVS